MKPSCIDTLRDEMNDSSQGNWQCPTQPLGNPTRSISLTFIMSAFIEHRAGPIGHANKSSTATNIVGHSMNRKMNRSRNNPKDKNTGPFRIPRHSNTSVIRPFPFILKNLCSSKLLAHLHSHLFRKIIWFALRRDHLSSLWCTMRYIFYE